MDHHQIARTLAAGRVVAGAAILLAPRLAARVWLGQPLPPGGSAVLVRALGVRDLALGWGTLQALARGDGATPWVELSAACDAVDGAATLAGLVGPNALRARRALPAVMVAGVSAVGGFAAAADLRRG